MQKVDHSQSTLRQRNIANATTADNDTSENKQCKEITEKKNGKRNNQLASRHQCSVLLRRLNFAVGVVVMLVAGYTVATHLYTIHENNLWFTNIREIEREISFRTESGLYYSYFKQLVAASSLSQGLYELTHDNLTEHLHTVNILARFNIYQEVLLAIFYRTLPFLQDSMPPIIFYITVVFALQGLLVCALYSISWQLTGSWLGGMLTACFFVFNRVDTTRVSQVLGLRENFALPFLWIQLAFLNCYFSRNSPRWKQVICIGGATVSTFIFAICWQFNQFVLLLQAMALFGVQLLHMLPHQKICTVYLIQAGSMLLVCGAQFYNAMIITSLLLSFLPAALIVMFIQSRVSLRSCGLLTRVLGILGYIVLVFALMAAINKFIQMFVWHEADEHIFRFVKSKFGLEDSIDFHVSMYLCNNGFGWLDWQIYTRLLKNFSLPLYVTAHFVCLAALAVALVQQHSHETKKSAKTKFEHIYGDRPELAFHTVHCVFLGIMAVTTLRMKFLWTPYVCLFASVCVSDSAIYKRLLSSFKTSDLMVDVVRHSITVTVLAVVLYESLPPLLKQLEYLGEFYDPDTVDLMQWIIKYAPPGAAFGGSMQLMAAVKLCTGRPITNHPHYEDRDLRDRTLALYKIYGQHSADDVHAILHTYNASYIILEDSICLQLPHDGCRLTDIIDVHYSQKSNDIQKTDMDEKPIPRFCDEVRYLKPSYKKHFKLMFQNHTFRVYKVL